LTCVRYTINGKFSNPMRRKFCVQCACFKREGALTDVKNVSRNCRSTTSRLCPVGRVMNASIEALDTRLRRLEYIITGSTSTLDTTSNKPDSSKTSIPNQILSLNDRLAKLVHSNKSIKKLLQTCTSHTLSSTNNSR